MQWKRCTKCNDLKPLDSFWKKGVDEYHSRCIKCMKEDQASRKEKKREYDKRRYEQKKKEKKRKNVQVCMRCEEYQVNVVNNQLRWCFYCLQKYEKEWHTKIPVIVVNPVIRRVNNE